MGWEPSLLALHISAVLGPDVHDQKWLQNLSVTGSVPSLGTPCFFYLKWKPKYLYGYHGTGLFVDNMAALVGKDLPSTTRTIFFVGYL